MSNIFTKDSKLHNLENDALISTCSQRYLNLKNLQTNTIIDDMDHSAAEGSPSGGSEECNSGGRLA